jgi:hypothetical protein
MLCMFVDDDQEANRQLLGKWNPMNTIVYVAIEKSQCQLSSPASQHGTV